jgi:hypothetical protein
MAVLLSDRRLTCNVRYASAALVKTHGKLTLVWTRLSVTPE